MKLWRGPKIGLARRQVRDSTGIARSAAGLSRDSEKAGIAAAAQPAFRRCRRSSRWRRLLVVRNAGWATSHISHSARKRGPATCQHRYSARNAGAAGGRSRFSFRKPLSPAADRRKKVESLKLPAPGALFSANRRWCRWQHPNLRQQGGAGTLQHLVSRWNRGPAGGATRLWAGAAVVPVAIVLFESELAMRLRGIASSCRKGRCSRWRKRRCG